MMPNKSIYRDADAAEINLYELNFARFFSIQTSENGWRRVVCELVRRAAKGTKELRLEDGTELPGEKTFPDYVVDLMDSYLAVLPEGKPPGPPAAGRDQLMERHCRHTEDGGIDYDYYQDMTLDTFIFNMRNVGAGALYAKRGPFWHGGHMEQCHFEELFRLIEEEGEKVFGETQERYADLAANDITAEAEPYKAGKGRRRRTMMNITPFSPAERKALMEELFPLKRTARDYDLRQDMTLDGYIASVIVRAQRQLDSGTLPSASVQFRRLADLVRNDITREAEELFRAWKDAEKETREEE